MAPIGRDMAVHRVDELEGDDLRASRGPPGAAWLQVGQIVVAPDALLPAAVADAGDHGGVVLLVREDDAAGQQLLQRAERGVVGDVAPK